LTNIAKNKDFPLFNAAEAIVGIVAAGITGYSKKQMKELENLAKSQQCGATGLFWAKIDSLEDKKFTTSFNNRFYDADDFYTWATEAKAATGDTMLIMAGPELKSWHTRQCLGKFRHELGTRLGLRNEGFYGLWVVDFPMLEYDEEAKRWHAMHHPFTSPKQEDLQYIDSDPGRMRANAYDMVINGVEVGGGSIRIHDQKLQSQVFSLLGFTPEAAQEQFGFLLGAFEYGAPPHGGLAFGLDRLCTILGGKTSIRDYIAFPKNKAGRDLMIQSPSQLTQEQLDELKVASTATEDDLKVAAHMWDVVEAKVSKKQKKKKNKGKNHPGGHGHGQGKPRNQGKQQGGKQAEAAPAPAPASEAAPAVTE
jgi:aspartyl-tRNA synthetase